MSQTKSVFNSALISISLRWADRLIGLISTIILARLLVPADFGLIAMASMVIALVDVFFEFGVHVALIRHPSPTQGHYDTAWTLRLIQATVATSIVVAVAPLAGDFFREPRLALLIQVMSISLVLSALENIGTITFQRDMHFGMYFRFEFSKRVFAFIVTIALALWFRSYWAMAVGALAGRAVGVFLSYRLHPMRARVGLTMFKEIFGVSQWMLIRGVGLFLHKKLPAIVVGRRENADVLGTFSLGAQIAAMPTNEMLAPLNRVLFPAFSSVQHDIPRLKRIYLLAQGVQTLVAMPAAVGLALVANEAVSLLLGSKWSAAVIFVQIFALGGFVSSITTSGGYVLLVLGKARLLAISTWINVVIFALLIFLAFPSFGAVDIAWLRLAFSAFGLVAAITLIVKQLEGLKLRDVFLSVVRPVIGVACMAACVYGVSRIPISGLWLLVAKVSVGAAVYALSIWVVWLAMGKRDGAETYLVEKVKTLRKRV